jgi:diguanylate cyclase (GGDEF)-like protein
LRNKSFAQPLGPEASAIAAILQKNGALYNHTIPSILYDLENQIIATNLAGTKLIGAITLKSPNLFTKLLKFAFKNHTKSRNICIEDTELNIILEFAPLELDEGQHVYLTQTSENTMEEPYERLESLVKISSSFIWETDKTGVFVFISGSNNFGYDLKNILGKHSGVFIPSNTNNSPTSPFMTKTLIQEAEVSFSQADGNIGTLITAAIPLWDRNEEWRGARGIGRNVTADRLRDIELAKAKNKEQTLNYIMSKIREPDDKLNSLDAVAQAITSALAADGCQILTFDKYGRQKSAALNGRLPFPITEKLNQGINKDNPLVFDESTYRFAVYATKYQKKANGILMFWGKGKSKCWDGEDFALFEQSAHLVGIELQHLHTQERLERLSTTDPLTGLLNRRTFTEILKNKFIHYKNKKIELGVFAYIDLDNFKLVNDLMGHQVGDEALITISRQLRLLTKNDDLIARLGGDEFSIWFDKMDEVTVKEKIKILLKNNSFLSKFSLNKKQPFGLSIGLATFEETDTDTLEQLISRADAAMYREKKRKQADSKQN